MEFLDNRRNSAETTQYQANQNYITKICHNIESNYKTKHSLTRQQITGE